MFIATALSPRGEDNIIVESTGSGASDCKTKRAFAGRTGNGIDGEHAASRFVSPPGTDIAHRFAIFVRRSRQQRRASFFGARIVSVCSIGEAAQRPLRSENKNNRQKNQEGTVKCPISGSI
jgi:hypothetical protein